MENTRTQEIHVFVDFILKHAHFGQFSRDIKTELDFTFHYDINVLKPQIHRVQYEYTG